jgi:hypothetical protein
MKEYHLSERTRLIVHDDGRAELFQDQGVQIRIELGAEEAEGLRVSLNAFRHTPTGKDLSRVLAGLPPFEPDSDDTLIKCPSCHQFAKKIQILVMEDVVKCDLCQ